VNHDPELWRFALEALDTGRPVGLLSVVESLGSSPGRAGFALCLTSDKTTGSIGGGAMEHRFIAETRRRLAEGGEGFLCRQVHDAAAEDRSGMICSGEQTFWYQPLTAADRPTVAALTLAAENRSGGVLTLGPTGLAFDPLATRPVRRRYAPGGAWLFEEDLGRRDRLHIVGGGHCGLALSRLAAGLDFEIFVYDDRPGLPTFEAITDAHHKVIVPSYAAMADHIEEGDDQYVCVMTFGYKTDDLVLRALMDRNVRFLGALGSRAKIDQLFATYTAEGISADRLRRIHAPLGLPIHSQTPAEIAVSIAAQLIRTRNEAVPRSFP
jgi:xanthine dehydrogenase accessory factor